MLIAPPSTQELKSICTIQVPAPPVVMLSFKVGVPTFTDWS